MSDASIYARQDFGKTMGFGRRAALLIVDFTVGFNDPSLFGGGNIDPAVRRTAGLLEFFRRSARPVAFSRVVYADDGVDAGVFTLKVPQLRILTESHPAGQVVPELKPAAGELIVRKTHASAFFGTPLASWLALRGVDTLVIAGCTTSGCVRASVVDASACNFRPIVAADCVGDRHLAAHEANLFDMAQKYADVMDRDAILAALAAGD